MSPEALDPANFESLDVLKAQAAEAPLNDGPEGPAEDPGAPLARQTLLEHLIEARKRLIICFGALLAGSCLAYLFAPEIYAFLAQPLADAGASEPRRMIYTGLTEAFVTYLKLALWGGTFFALPVIAWQLWLFVAPGLYRDERPVFLGFLIASPLLFLTGAALAYFFVFPLAWRFFLGFESPAGPENLPIQLEARVSEYLSLSMTLLLAFGIAFQLPVLLLMLIRAKILSSMTLKRFRRYAIVLAFVVAAVLTPPDVVSQLCLAVPLLLLYEGSILAARWIEPTPAPPEAMGLDPDSES